MKKTAFMFTLLSIGTLGFALTSTDTVYFGSTDFAIGKRKAMISHAIVGLGYREVVSPRDTGFYYGCDLFLGYPVSSTEIREDFETKYWSDEDLFMSIKAPLGYRWPAEDKKMGFFLGGGPSAQLLADFGNGPVSALGGFVEVGWQTNKSSGIGLHLGIQLGLSPLMSSRGDELEWEGMAGEAAIQVGMSWRRFRHRD